MISDRPMISSAFALLLSTWATASLAFGVGDFCSSKLRITVWVSSRPCASFFSLLKIFTFGQRYVEDTIQGSTHFCHQVHWTAADRCLLAVR